MKFGRSSNHLGSFASDPSFGIAGNTYWNTALSALKIHNGTSWGLFSSGGGGGDLELGETSTTAYRGDRGKTAYDHSQATHDKSFVGLANVDNTSDANKPVSTAQQTALDLKANLVSPNFTGTPIAPTASVSTNTTQIATTAFVIAEVLARLASNDAMLYKGTIDCSTNPNYPASDAGHTYRVSVAGKIGGASGPNVEVGDRITCNTDGTSAGTHGSVGSNWDILQINIDGAVTGQASSVEDELALFSGSSGKVIKRASASGIALLTSGVLSVLASSGSGNVARVNSPTFVTPVLGVASATSLSVGDDAYGSGWNGSTDVPTKNAIYDKIETIGGGGGSSYDESNPILDSSSNELAQFFKLTTAVNHVAIANAGSGSAPILGATGDDANINLNLQWKGTGFVDLGANPAVGTSRVALRYRESSVDMFKVESTTALSNATRLTLGYSNGIICTGNGTGPITIESGNYISSGLCVKDGVEIGNTVHYWYPTSIRSIFDVKPVTITNYENGTDGSVSRFRVVSFDGNISGRTLTNSATLQIDGAPTQTANITITNKYALWVKGGVSKFDGAICPPSLADASAPNNSIYYSTDASKLVYKDSGGTVNNLY